MKNIAELVKEHIEREPPTRIIDSAIINVSLDIATELNRSLAQFGLPTFVNLDMIEVKVSWRFKDDSGL